MQDFQERVMAERSELDSKIEKLYVFIHGTVYATLPEAERFRMMRQYCHMKDYSNVLGERVAAFAMTTQVGG